MAFCLSKNLRISSLLKQTAVKPLKRTVFTKRSTIHDATYGGRHTVSIIPGDGIGPALLTGVQNVFQNAGVPIDFEECHLTGDSPEEINKSFENIKTSIQRNGRALKGNWITNYDNLSSSAVKSFNVLLRHHLDLYANVVKCKSYPSVKTRHENIDLTIIRENTEGEYTNLEHENVSGVVEMMKIITEPKSERIARFAFDYAVNNNRKKVTAVHKANIMKMSDGLFLNVCREVSKCYPYIEFNDMIIDNCAMQMVSRPEQFDVMVMPNLYGNVLTSIAAALVGGPGIPHGENHGDNLHVYESGTRNSGRDICHHNIANPMSVLFAASAMLRDIKLERHANLIDDCIRDIVVSNRARTQDIGGETSTTEFVDILVNEIYNKRSNRVDKQ